MGLPSFYSIAVNLGIFQGIWEHRVYKCRPAGAWSLGDTRFYTNADPPGRPKTTHSPHILRDDTIEVPARQRFSHSEKHAYFS